METFKILPPKLYDLLISRITEDEKREFNWFFSDCEDQKHVNSVTSESNTSQNPTVGKSETKTLNWISFNEVLKLKK